MSLSALLNRRMVNLGWAAVIALLAMVVGTFGKSDGDEETAIVNVIRHGEKCADGGHNISKVGKARAEYLANCMSDGGPSSALPWGRPTAVMAGHCPKSYRPIETVAALADKLGVKVLMKCHKRHHHCFVHHMKKHLEDKGTLVFAWAHSDIPGIISALNIPNLPDEYSEWPKTCNSDYFIEPACTYTVSASAGASVCYDAIWQIKFTRSTHHDHWKPRSIRTLAEGFGGSSSSACAQDLKPRALSKAGEVDPQGSIPGSASGVILLLLAAVFLLGAITGLVCTKGLLFLRDYSLVKNDHEEE